MSRTSTDAPLVTLTSLAIAGSGTIAASIAASLIWQAPVSSALAVGTGLLGAGMAASLTHLGRPARAPLAGRGVGRSPLSNEVALAMVAIGFGAAAASGLGGAALCLALQLCALASSLAVLILVGLVYRIEGQLSWRGAAVWAPIASGLLAGTCMAAAIVPGVGTALVGPTLVLVAVDGVVTAARWRTVSRLSRGTLSREDRMLGGWRRMLTWRVVVFDMATAALTLLGASAVAALAAAIGLLIDRVAFYQSACPLTTEAEIDRVEGLIDPSRSR